MRGCEIEAVAEAISLQLTEQREPWRTGEDARADEGRAVTDDEHVQIGGEFEQLRLRSGIAWRRLVPRRSH